MLEKRPLPEGCFYDKEGKETTDPDMAEAVKAFGGPKGFALCYAIEILTGAFVGCKMGQKWKMNMIWDFCLLLFRLICLVI